MKKIEYLAPEMEVVKINGCQLMTASNGDNSTGGGTVSPFPPTDGDDDDED